MYTGKNVIWWKLPLPLEIINPKSIIETSALIALSWEKNKIFYLVLTDIKTRLNYRSIDMLRVSKWLICDEQWAPKNDETLSTSVNFAMRHKIPFDGRRFDTNLNSFPQDWFFGTLGIISYMLSSLENSRKIAGTN